MGWEIAIFFMVQIDDRMSEKKTKRCRRLSREEKKAVWNTKTEENAGAGWQAHGGSQEPRYPEYERLTPKPVDEEFK